VLIRALDLANAYRAERQEAAAAKREGRRRGPTTGIRQLDSALGGYLAPGLYVIHGAAGAGKSALANQIAGSCDCPAQFVTTEMAPLELLRRHVARLGSMARGVLLSGNLAEEREEDLLLGALGFLSQLHYTDAVTEPALVPVVMANQIEVQWDSEFSLLVIDSIHTWAESIAQPGMGGEYEQLGSAMQKLREVSAKLNIPILMVAERNRMSMKVGSVSASAGSRKLEYGPDVVMGLDVDEEQSTPDTKQVSLKIYKNRMGPSGLTIPLVFQADVMRLFPKDIYA